MPSIEPPAHIVINSAFKEKGIDNVVKIEILHVSSNEKIKIVFEECKSKWRQGVFLKIDNFLVINGQRYPSAQLWQDSAPEH